MTIISIIIVVCLARIVYGGLARTIVHNGDSDFDVSNSAVHLDRDLPGYIPDHRVQREPLQVGITCAGERQWDDRAGGLDGSFHVCDSPEAPTTRQIQVLEDECFNHPSFHHLLDTVLYHDGDIHVYQSGSGGKGQL